MSSSNSVELDSNISIKSLAACKTCTCNAAVSPLQICHSNFEIEENIYFTTFIILLA